MKWNSCSTRKETMTEQRQKSRIVDEALSSLGKGFDVTSDCRLKFCKGGDQRLVVLDETHRRDVSFPGFGHVANISADIRCDKGDRIRYQSDILDFNQMAEFFNQKSSIPGKIPSGWFNSIFGFSGSWAKDAARTRYMGLDGYFITLFHLRIPTFHLRLSPQVLHAVPSSWDPSALARFIETYGTHIIVGLGIGGQDVILMKQDIYSKLGPSELRKHLDDLGDQLFTGACSFPPRIREQKLKVPQAFNVFDTQLIAFNGFSSINAKDGITILCSKRGGDISANSHSEWLLTVPEMPDAIQFNFIPITSLLKGVPGSGFLSHAINLYLRYKPPIGDLQYFLDFQSHKLWAPIHNDLPLGPSPHKNFPSQALNFNLMGPRLYVSTTQVTVEKRPVTGMRLFLEGMKCNRLAIHLQYLSNLPTMLEDKIEDTQFWQGSEAASNSDHRFFEPIHRKNLSHICTAPIKYDPNWATKQDEEAFIVTGAQLFVKKHDSKKVLHLRLLFSRVNNFYVAQSAWAEEPSELSSQRSGLLSAISTSLGGNNNAAKEKKQLVVVDSSVFPTGPPVPVQEQKLLRFVDTTQFCRGPQDIPGHWLVTGARLELEKGKICLRVKFSLLNTCS